MAFSKSTPISLPSGSPSLQPNNLSSFNDLIAFTRLSEVVVASTSGEAIKLPGHRAQIHQASFVSIRGSHYLAIASNLGLQLWTPEGENMLFFYPLTSVLSGEEAGFFRGLTSSTNFLGVGVSTGEVLVFDVPSVAGGEIILQHKLEGSKHPITCMASSAKYLIGASANGEIIGYNAFEAFSISLRFSGRQVQDAICTSLIIRDETFAAAFSSGHIRIYRINIGELALEITGHIRPVYGLALHSRLNIFASCSEDQFVHVWSWPDFESRSSSNVDLLSSHKLDNRICTGIAFLPRDRIAVASYDECDLIILQKDSSDL